MQLPYILQPLDTSSPEQVKEIMAKLKELPSTVLVDCPGNINDPALRHIYAAADIAVVPFRYDADNLDATDLFAGVFKRLSNARMIFVPNSVNAIEERRAEVQAARDKAYDVLKKYGFISKRINQGVAVKCYSTIFPRDKYQKTATKFAFEQIKDSITMGM